MDGPQEVIRYLSIDDGMEAEPDAHLSKTRFRSPCGMVNFHKCVRSPNATIAVMHCFCGESEIYKAQLLSET